MIRKICVVAFAFSSILFLAGRPAFAQCKVHITASPGATVCAGQTVTLAVDISQCPTGATYHWSTSATTSTINVTTSGDYSVTVTDASSNTDRDTITVTVNALPVPAITGSTCCKVGTNNVNYSTALTGNNFSWSVTGGIIVSGQGSNSIYVNWTSSGTGTVSVIETNPANSCSKTATLNVIVTSVTFSATPVGSACDGKIQLATTYPPHSAGMTYVWKSNNSTIGTTRDLLHQFSAYGTGSTTFQVKLIVTHPGGCKDSITSPVTVTNRPDASIQNTNPAPDGEWTHCIQGEDTTFTVVINNTSSTTGTNTYYEIDWDDGSVHYSSSVPPMGVSHTYSLRKMFYLKLTVTNAQCSTIKIYNVFNGSNPQGGISNIGNTTNYAAYQRRSNMFFRKIHF